MHSNDLTLPNLENSISRSISEFFKKSILVFLTIIVGGEERKNAIKYKRIKLDSKSFYLKKQQKQG